LATSSQALRLSFHSTVSLTVVTVAERSCPVSRPLWPNQACGPSSETASGLPVALFTATWTDPDSIKYDASLVSPCENMITPALKEHSSILSRSLATSSRFRPGAQTFHIHFSFEREHSVVFPVMEPLVRRSSLGQRERKYGALAEFALQPDSASM
jgi:hypothetical protein